MLGILWVIFPILFQNFKGNDFLAALQSLSPFYNICDIGDYDKLAQLKCIVNAEFAFIAVLMAWLERRKLARLVGAEPS